MSCFLELLNPLQTKSIVRLQTDRISLLLIDRIQHDAYLQKLFSFPISMAIFLVVSVVGTCSLKGTCK